MIRRRQARRGCFSLYRISFVALLFCTGVYFLNLIQIHEKQVMPVVSTVGSGLPPVSGNPAVTFPSSRKKSCAAARTAEDLKHCSRAKVFNDLGPSCERIETWGDVNRCLVRRFAPEVADNYKIHIIGERNSGTKFIMRDLQQCFPKKTFNVHVHRDFVRAKHFFQPIRLSQEHNAFRKSILVSIFRDPVDWTAAMIEKPYHSPNHIAGFDNVTNAVISLPWQDFVSRRWKTPRSDFDLELITSGRIKETFSRLVCANQFTFPEVVPCRYDNTSTLIPEERFRGYEPVYELRRDGTGRSFEHILELRSEKIFNFLLELPLLVKLGGYAAVRYEDLLKDGTQSFLEQIAHIMGMDGLPTSCKPTPPQPQRLGQREIPDGLRQWVNEHVDVERERLLGYRD
jgi:hypothetical protein